MSVTIAWAPYFDPAVKMRGRAYLNEGRVRREPAQEDELARAAVESSEGIYDVTITRDGRSAVAECGCPHFESGHYCKHIWATLLSIEAAQTNGSPSDDDDDADAAEGDNRFTAEVARRVGELTPKSPTARKRAAVSRSRVVNAGGLRFETPPPSPREPTWLSRLSLLRPGRNELERESAGLEEAFPATRRIVYVLQAELSARSNAPVIQVRQQVPIRTGWGKPKSFRVDADSIDSLEDPLDRELTGLLLGASRIDEYSGTGAWHRGGDGFKLAHGTRRLMLRRMIDTGRCVLEVGSGREAGLTPLRWDRGATGGPQPATPDRGPQDASAAGEADVPAPTPLEPKAGDTSPHGEPWRLYLHGIEGDGELLVDVELRRGDKRMSIDRPSLVLGGADGVVIWKGRVAPLDDHDAIQWARQFRDDRYRQYDRQGDSEHDAGDGRMLRVPMEDLPRFLDRLYALPNLPRLDLPEGIAREEARLDPVPHLDLETAAAMSGKRGSVNGRIWFSYGSKQAEPGDTSQFLSTPTATAAPTADPPSASPTDPASDSDAAHRTSDIAHPTSPAPDPLHPAAARAGLIRRDRRRELRLIRRLSSLGFRQAYTGEGTTVSIPAAELSPAVRHLLVEGWKVTAKSQPLKQAKAPRLSVTSGIDWFELHGSVTFDRGDGTQQHIALPDILKAARAGDSVVTLDDGTHGLLPEQWLEQNGLLAGLGKVSGDHIRFANSQAALLDILLEQQAGEVFLDDRFEEVRHRLRTFTGVQPEHAGPDFTGTLRPYQQQGLGWLSFLRWLGVGGVLADDMGLGKTIQVLAMLQKRRMGDGRSAVGDGQSQSDGSESEISNIKSEISNPEFQSSTPESEDATLESPSSPPASAQRPTPNAHRPSLIVAPRSVVFNWIDEAKKFTPDLKVAGYLGPDRSELLPKLGEYDLIVTSYGLMRRDIEQLLEHRFDYAVLDEAQAIKNPGSQAAKAARLLPADHRLALTGTPIENHLGDLWSLFEFLNTGMLGSGGRFDDLVKSAGSGRKPATASANPSLEVEEDDGPDSLELLSKALRPFILRRTKKQVLHDLPPKTEQTIHCEMAPEQRKIYNSLRDYYRQQLLQGAAASDKALTGGQQSFQVLEALLRLRQAACHPALIAKADLSTAAADGADSAPSAKLDELVDRLTEIIQEGGKSLVFSQFTSMLALVKERLDKLGIAYCYLDGKTRDRKAEVEKFQTDESIPVFLISLKAGGTGLNLTAAEYVFLLDPWWNPAVERQAIDRTHRIGQTNPVFAYRLICEDTVEERVLELQQQKRELADAVIGEGDNLLKQLTREDLERLFS